MILWAGLLLWLNLNLILINHIFPFIMYHLKFPIMVYAIVILLTIEINNSCINDI